MTMGGLGRRIDGGARLGEQLACQDRTEGVRVLRRRERGKRGKGRRTFSSAHRLEREGEAEETRVVMPSHPAREKSVLESIE